MGHGGSDKMLRLETEHILIIVCTVCGDLNCVRRQFAVLCSRFTKLRIYMWYSRLYITGRVKTTIFSKWYSVEQVL